MSSEAGSVFLVAILSFLLPSTPARAQASSPRKTTVAPSAPLAFEPNVGQADTSVKYVARGGDYAVALTADGAALALGASGASVRLRVAGGSAARLVASDELPGKSNYLVGARSRWKRNVPTSRAVRYESVYPGVDVAFYG